MTLRIQCPACERQFKVSEELKGRTVECGGCEHRFELNDKVLVARRGKFYPGEAKRSGLEGFGRAQKSGPASVEFETAAYNQTQSVADFIPISPQQLLATSLGVSVMVMTVVLLILGTQPQGVLSDMEVVKRSILAFFMVAVGVALVLYGCHHRRRVGYLISVVSIALVMSLALFMPVPRTVGTGDYVPLEGGADRPSVDRPPVERRKTAEEVRAMVGYGPVERAIASRMTSDVDGSEFVTAVWVTTMEERFKFQIQKYLHRKTGTEERPSFYRRGAGGLFVIDGARLSLERMTGIVERFGRVEEQYPEIRILEVTLEGGRLLEADKKLLEKLTDREHPAFYALNLTELDHIDLDRVEAAVNRLSEAEPKRLRIEIARRLVELVEEESDPQLEEAVCRALVTWSDPGDGSEEVVLASARDVLKSGARMPRGILEYLAFRKQPEAVPIVEGLWVMQPSTWESVMEQFGPIAEDTVLQHIQSENRGVRQSAVRLLKRMGSRRSVEHLRALLDGADDELKVLLQGAIDSIESDGAEPVREEPVREEPAREEPVGEEPARAVPVDEEPGS